MATTGPGPKMIIDQVVQAERIVQDAVTQQQAVAQQLQAQGSASRVAMTAPAGQIPPHNTAAHSGAGRALAETLNQLQLDLARTRQVLLAGADDATSVAGKVQVGFGGAIASQL